MLNKEEKNKALVNIIIDYASAMIKIFANNDIVEALGLLEVQNKIFKSYLGVIESQSINQSDRIPGGLVSSINEQGGEIVNLPDGSKIIPNDISDRIVNKKIIIGTNQPRIDLPEGGFRLKLVNTKLTTKQLKKTIKKLKKDLNS